MTSTIQVKREVQKIKQRVKPKDRQGIAWNNGDGTFNMHGYTFKSEKKLMEYADEEGFTILHIVGWGK